MNPTTDQLMKPSHHAFAVKDVKTGLFERPFFDKTIQGAIRNLTVVVADPKSLLNRYPKDYQLYKVGSWFEEIGYLEPTEPLQLLCEIEALMPQAQEQNRE